MAFEERKESEKSLEYHLVKEDLGFMLIRYRFILFNV